MVISTMAQLGDLSTGRVRVGRTVGATEGAVEPDLRQNRGWNPRSAGHRGLLLGARGLLPLGWGKPTERARMGRAPPALTLRPIDAFFSPQP